MSHNTDSLLNVAMRGYKEASLEGVANDVCERMPEGFLLSLSFEDGAATVQLQGRDGDQVELPDPADKTLLEQLDDGLRTAHSKAASC